MAEAQTIPAESEALGRVLDSIDELGLTHNIVELETHGFTTVKGVLSDSQIERAKAAIAARVEKHLGSKLDLDNATAEDFQGMTYVPYMLYEDEIFEEILVEPKPLALITYLLGESCLLSSMGCHFRGPGGAPLPLHSDNGNGIPEPHPILDATYNVGRIWNGSDRAVVSMDIDPGDAVVWHGNTWHGSFVRELPGVRMNLAVYFNRQYIRTQEHHGDAVPEEVRERHANDTRFLNLLGAKQPYGWRQDGPDYSKFALMPRGLYD